MPAKEALSTQTNHDMVLTHQDSGIASLVIVAQLASVALSADNLKHLAGQVGDVDAVTLVRLAKKK